MDYKDARNMRDEHLIFQKVLELETFDDSSPAMAETLLAQLKLRPGAGHNAKPNDVENALSELVYFRCLERVGNGVRVTKAGRDWAQVFQLLPDGLFKVFGSAVEEAAWPTFKRALYAFNRDLSDIRKSLHCFLGEHTTPARLSLLTRATTVLTELPTFPANIVESEMCRQAAVLACREELLRLQERKEMLVVRARDRHVMHRNELEIDHLKSILAIPGLATALTTPKPRVTDFVNIGVIKEKSRATDEKFGILAAPTLFSSDYKAAADGAFSRDRSFAVGFVDIDNFKDFNTAHLETVVDQDMLPNFMRALEAYCYGRAIAYRQGGDEYLVLLHNADEGEARTFFAGLQAHIAKIEYPDTIPDNPTVSIGVHVIDGTHEVTVFEAQKRANQAKDAAKAAGRKCVRLSTDPASNPQVETTP